MIHTQRWEPDTCGCVIIETWDDALPPDERVHIYQSSERICQMHQNAGVTPGPGHRVRVHDENTRKNITFELVLERLSSLPYENYVWTYESDGVLRVWFRNINPTPQQIAQIQTRCDQRFGVGRVLIMGSI